MNIIRKTSQGIGCLLFTPVIIFVMLMAVLLFIAVFEAEDDG